MASTSPATLPPPTSPPAASVPAARPTPSRIPTSRSREHILSESSTGWSPLRIAKRPSAPSRGLSDASSSLSVEGGGPAGEDRPRRTSNSYKHLKSNSLVSNSPFKQEPSPRQGGSFSDSGSPKRAGGSAAGTYGLGIGLGQSPARRAAAAGIVRKSSKDGSGWRVSGSGGTENEPLSSDDDEADVPAGVAARQDAFRKRTKGRQSAGLANLGQRAKVTNSPFLELSAPPPAAEISLPLPALSPSAEDTTPSLSETSSFPSPPPPDDDDALSLPGSPPSLKPTPLSEPVALPLLTPSTPTKPLTNLPAHVAPDAPPTPSPKSSLKLQGRQQPRTAAQRHVVRERRKTVTFDERPDISVFEREPSAELSSALGSDDENEYGEPYGRRPTHAPPQEEYAYELSPNPQLGSDDDGPSDGNTSFEFDLSPSPLLTLGSDVQHRAGDDDEDEADEYDGKQLANLSLGSYSSDYSLNELDLGADDDEDPEDFVNRLLAENQLLSPVPATQTVFERYSADAEEVFGSSHSVALGISTADSDAPESREPSPAVRHLDLPHLGASEADPILMNGDVREPSTHLLPRSRSSKANLAAALSPSPSPEQAAAAHGPAHAHQSGPLPDPFLTVQTVQRIVGSPAHGLPSEEGGVPLGRTHHAERHKAVGELREGLGSTPKRAQEARRSVEPEQTTDGVDVFGEKLALIDSPMKAPAAAPAADRSLAPLNPYSLPSLKSQSPLFSAWDMSTPDPASTAGGASEFGAGFQYKPSSSLERLQQGDVGGSVGSSGGRSPRLTKESIRRRMELKAAAAAGGPSKGAEPASQGLGLGLEEAPVSPAAGSGSPVKKDKPLPPAPSSVECPQRPTISTASRAMSTEELLSTESALGKLAGRPATSPVVINGADQLPALKAGNAKDVQISPVSSTFVQSASTPVEETATIRRSLSRAALDAQLMPPPPLPLPRPASPITNVIRAPSPAPSQQSQSGDEGPNGRADAIIARKREKRAEAGDLDVPSSVSRRSRPRRSMSQGDVADDAASSSSSSQRQSTFRDAKGNERKMGRLSIGPAARNSANLAELNQEFARIGEEKNHRYTLIEHKQVYVASDEKVSHGGRAGDLDRGRAWRSVKRPSDMNEYADEIREIRLREKPGRAHAKVFVKIVSMSDLTVPLPSQSSFRIALNNGLHSVETASYPLKSKVDIGQEFELLGLENLEFSLAIKVKKDNHIATRLKALNPPPPEPPATPPKKESGFRKLMSSPRRTPKASPARVVEEPPKDELVRYLAADGTLATVKVVFKDIAARCNGQLLSLHLPLSGKWNDDSIAYSSRFASSDAVRRSKTIGRMELQLIMIPSLPGLTQDQLPQSLEDAVVGLRHARWHKMDYFSGTLTQLGGDCSSWRRRQMRIVGGTLEATNDVTGKITARIDLAKMTAIRDYNAEEASGAVDDRPMSVERSFGLVFDDGEEIQFFADKDQDKLEWIAHLNELLGRVPSLPLWAELLWVKQQQQQAPASASAPRTSQTAPWR